ncbi:ABC transporter ATP-binding protein [Neorhizobium sp. LjRoot104]|uniref:ABC transporter ATP-binding protein n=1 Tax=Neorhizobium sp. LjRoot104 TaxID=3342254 RepID=UPI003ECCB0B5
MTLAVEQVADPPPTEADEALLSINNVEVIFNDVILVLRGISLDARKGKVTALLGANGAGKSTTLKAIAGLLLTEDGEISRGTVTYDGRDVTYAAADRKVRDGIFLVMEGRGIIQDMTIRDNLRLGAFTRPDARVEAEIEQVYRFFPRLKERTGLAGYLSGGEQQMLAIGRAMMAKPRLIMMDEPSMGLSPLLVKEVFGIIRRLNRELGISILLVEQNANMALKIADYGYIMENGKIVLDGPAEELMRNEDVKEFYLGGGEERRSFLNVKSFRRRKRWL